LFAALKPLKRYFAVIRLNTSPKRGANDQFKPILLSPIPSSEAAWLPRLVVKCWRAALLFCAANKRDVASAWLVLDAVVPRTVYGLKYEKTQSVFTLVFAANHLWHLLSPAGGVAERRPVRSPDEFVCRHTSRPMENEDPWFTELEIAIASGHESLIKALAWQTGSRFSPLGREL
jgi:hypothetical protein